MTGMSSGDRVGAARTTQSTSGRDGTGRDIDDRHGTADSMMEGRVVWMNANRRRVR